MKELFKIIIVAILTLEAKLLLRRTKPHIVAITGSVGKTSTKDAIYAVVKDKIHTRRSERSFNSEIGVPLTILGLETAWSNPFGWLKNIFEGFLLVLHPGSYPKLLILEMGVDRPGDMKKLASWIHPDIILLTRLPDIPVHVEFFGTPEAVIEEKLHILNSLKPEGVFVYNQDDSKIQEIAEGVRQESIGYSRYSLSSYTASADKILYESGVPVGIECTLTHGDKAVVTRVLGSLGVQHAYNNAAAAAVASIFDVSLEEVAVALRNYVPPPGRMRILSGIKNTLIIDDSYNSSPVASERSLQTLKELNGVNRKIVVFGDMMELGQYSVEEHERMGALVASSADVLITLGIRSRKTAEGALENGMDEKFVFQYDDAQRAGKELELMLEEGDAVLVKGSQSIRAERVVEEIIANPEDVEELLVRQDIHWTDK